MKDHECDFKRGKIIDIIVDGDGRNYYCRMCRYKLEFEQIDKKTLNAIERNRR